MSETAEPVPALEEAGDLLFLPLGGAGEIGMNLNLYAAAGKWLMVDLGLTFADDFLPGVDLVFPDPAFIAERREDLVGLVLTHAHEDHLGAVPYLWPMLRCPVYATAFTASILRNKLSEAGLIDEVPLIEVSPGTPLELGPFEVTYIGVTHSIPEANALAIRTASGTVLHSGDWKLDPEPLVGPRTDEAALAALGEEGVDALVCDSTNVFQPGVSGSEAAVRASLGDIIGAREGRRVAVTTFASHVARIETVATVAAAHGRQVVLIGRSLWRILKVARANGYLDGLAPFLEAHEAGHLASGDVLLLCTGCQGEARGAMSRVAFDEHRDAALGAGDVAIFSSKIIPGNEASIGRLHNQLVRKGVEVITEKDHFVHVSGHPYRDDLARMYRWIRPRAAVPVHGEALHLLEHARFAQSLGVPETAVPENGAVVRLVPGPAEIVAHVAAGRLALDGDVLVPVASKAIQTRRRVMHDGSAVVTLVADRAGRLLAPPSVVTLGLDSAVAGHEAETVAALADTLAALPRGVLEDDESFAEAARVALMRRLRAASGKRPLVKARVVRIASPGGAADGQDKGSRE